jgi:hypothetical protein
MDARPPLNLANSKGKKHLCPFFETYLDGNSFFYLLFGEHFEKFKKKA